MISEHHPHVPRDVTLREATFQKQLEEAFEDPRKMMETNH